MRRYGLLLCGWICLLSLAGCQCFRVTHWYGNAIDDISDSKLEWDALYVPGLDISRVGMPDWQEFGINRFLCPCRNGRCCRNCGPIYYPAEYRMKYWAMQAEQTTDTFVEGGTDQDAEELDPLPPALLPTPEGFTPENPPLPAPVEQPGRETP